MLETPRILLRWDRVDLDDLAAFAENPHMSPQMRSRPQPSKEKSR